MITTTIENTETGNTQNEAQQAKLKILPIILLSFDSRKVAGKLFNSTNPEVSVQAKAFRTDSVKIQCIDIELFRIVQKYFTKINTNFQTFSLHEDKF